METTKPWWQSTTVWASIIATIVGIATMFKLVNIGPVQVENLAVESQGISQTIVGAIEMALGIVSLWGRLTAKKVLTP